MFRSRCLILLYHRVARIPSDPWSLCLTPEHFAEHLEVLRKYRRVRLDRLNPGWSFGEKLTVAVTFDDGYADNLHEAKPLLARYSTPATFFIATGSIGETREFWWDELERIVMQSETPPRSPDIVNETREEIYQRIYAELQPLSHAVRRELLDEMLAASGQSAAARPTHQTLTLEELKQLAADDLFEIGAHTVTHPLLAAQPVETQDRELRESKSWLETLLERPVTSFSYPYGGSSHYSSETVQAVRRAGFERACTTNARPVSRSENRHEWGRINITDMDGDQFQQLLFA
jgi:peptidoglycan/xylan/chitin deacetylase (PgdA/CDA1 family)